MYLEFLFYYEAPIHLIAHGGNKDSFIKDSFIKKKFKWNLESSIKYF